MKKYFALGLLALLCALPAAAHGVRINHSIDPTSGAITVTAAFDTGEVLDDAAVVIFAPDDLINPWASDTLDAQGSYTFTPDYSIEGFWDVQVRKAGHGGLINIEISAAMQPDPDAAAANAAAPRVDVSDDGEIVINGDATVRVNGDVVISATGSITGEVAQANAAASTGFTPAQIIIMSLSVTWGFVGTALYYLGRGARRKNDD